MKAVSSDEILLTGATGVLGAHLLKDLLRLTKSRIHCLVRADSTEHAKERLLKFLGVYDPKGELLEEFDKRVVPIAGDMTRERFGLDDKTYQALTETIETTIHSAANTNLFLSYRRIEPINIGGTKNIIRFCLATKNKYLCHISTHTIMGDKTFEGGIVFKETDYDIGQGFDHMTYQQTKFISEGMVRDAAREGLIYNIFRPGQIFGDAEHGNYPQGHSSVDGLFYDILKTVSETGVAFYSATHFDVVPVDYVSRGILEIGLRRGSFFENFHLTNPNTRTYTEVIGLLQEIGYRINFVHQLDYKKMLNERTLTLNGEEYKSSTTSAFKWWFKRDIDFSESAVTDATYTAKVLAEHGVACPLVDAKLMSTYVEAGLRTNYFPRLPRPVPRTETEAPREVFV